MMGGTFLININCSKILGNEVAHYIMLIDSSKMSIVYELVEWIRWMFSLEYCFYLTHENSVIHELEDIQVLSKLKNFEIKPCGQLHCVHKKNYRILLRNLSLFASWNDMKVHKYFLDKINQMNEKLTRESTEHNYRTHFRVHESNRCFNTEADSSKQIAPQENKLYFHENQPSESTTRDMSVPENMCATDDYYKSTINATSPSTINGHLDTKMMDENLLFNLNDTSGFSLTSKDLENKSSENKKQCVSRFNKNSPDKDPTKKDSLYQRSTKNHTKAKALNKPFSLGEILSKIRKDFEQKNVKISPKENISQRDSSSEDMNSETKSMAVENSFFLQDVGAVGKKKQRTRTRRRRPKKQNLENKYFTSNVLENEKPVCSLNISKSDCSLKPNHIRFYEDVENDLMEFEGTSIENELQFNNKELNNTSTSEFVKNESEEMMSVVNSQHQDVSQKSVVYSSEKNNKVECLSVSDKVMGEEKVIVTEHEDSSKVDLPSSVQKNIELNDVNPDLNALLSLRDKFKNGVVIQRFY